MELITTPIVADAIKAATGADSVLTKWERLFNMEANMSNEIVITSNVGGYSIIPENTTDDRLVEMWIARKNSVATRTQYRHCWALFRAAVPVPLQSVNLATLQAWADNLRGSANTKKAHVAVVKALFSFGMKCGYLRLNPAALLEAPKGKDSLAQRILSEEQVFALIRSTTNQRDRVLLRVLYASGGRVSEICNLTWADVTPNGDSGQLTLFGKGDKTRQVKLSAATYQALIAIDADHTPTRPVFVSRKGGKLDTSQVLRIVQSAARRAGIPGNVSPHWLRHAHASHSLDRGASIALVQSTLGHSSLTTTSRYTHAKPGDSSALHLAV